MREELRRRKQEKYLNNHEARQSYLELLEYIHTRYNHAREDQPERARELSPLEKKYITEHKLLRLPGELERRFMEIVYVIIEDSWELPVGS